MFIAHKIIEDKGLLILKFIGEWSLEDYKVSLDKVIKNEKFESIQKVLSDFREISAGPDSESAFNQIEELAEIRKEVIKKKYVHVRIISGPLSTVVAHLYKEELNKMGYLDNYCSTIDHAIKLLNIDMSIKELEDLLNNLKVKL